MGAKSFTIKGAATSMTVVGGADAIYNETGKDIPAGLQSSVTAVTDFRVQPFAEFKNRQPVYNTADGSYSKAKRELKLVFPRLDATTNKVSFDVVRLTMEVAPTTSLADHLDMRLRGGQCLGLAALQTFWETGSLN